MGSDADRLREHRRKQAERDRRRRQRRRDERNARISRSEACRRAQMRRTIRDAYQGEHAPVPGSPRDLRLRILALSLRELAARSDLSRTTVHRIERGDTSVTGPTLRQYAKTIERLTGRRTRFEDVRRMMRDAR
ncbi:helix-turn-helix domain-containing protein [Conexibacter arvalis]|uniref:Transcriptional regulator with XRE-family HTH domain n=1 Tax=Conexibacter arvalis TaxID=912552 RepID=A0A840IFP6_9ACTN|nr:helix-turn-helix transcriptional regulator [Conexibacter arvalis]MBB4663013.1 transcriptional regulator with XRE-family HTH domain [Conexibacter arvalis]